MADPTDPLSTATRATKRNLLVVSVLAISANAFNVSVEKIPVGPLAINFDDRLFAFLIFVVLVYFLGTFILYLVIDLKNFAMTRHQDTSEKEYRSRLAGFNIGYANRVRQDLDQFAPHGFRIVLTSSFDKQILQNRADVVSYEVMSFAQPVPEKLVRAEHAELFQTIDNRIAYWVTKYSRSSTFDARRARILISSIRLMYFTRSYLVDGALPILLGVIALTAVLGLIHLHWLQDLFPRFNALHVT